jgi:23S rRNA (adenine2503-C2)-methyltransferase
MSEKLNLRELSKEDLEAFVLGLGWRRFRAEQIFAWIYRKGAEGFDQMTNLSQEDRALLNRRARLSRLRLLTVQRSDDGTEKYLFDLEDGNRIESVLIPDAKGTGERSRLTLCLSTQAGCTLDCSFCLTGEEKLKRNLDPHEIVDQVLAVQRAIGSRRRLTNLVMMGMGEPLANLKNLQEALRRLTSPEGAGFSPRRITVSTAGLVPQMKKLGEFPIKANLAVSLNATTDGVRDVLMPINRKYPLKELIAACRDFPLPPRRRITFEYVLLAGVNDAPEDAVRLTRLVRGLRCKINLIPFNEFPGSEFKRPSDGRVLDFQKIVHAANLTATVRKSKGHDILAACGQLTGIELHDPASALTSSA